MFSEPFRGSGAVAAGLVTAKELRGPRFRRLFRDVHVAASVPVDLHLRSRAAHLVVAGRGVLGGWSAAELLGASCGPAGAPAEVVVRSRTRPQPGLRIRHEVLPPDEITDVDGIAVTSPTRTAYDLGCRAPPVEAVVAVDALARVGDLAPGEVLRLGRRHLGARGSARLPEVIGLADPRSGSPMETRIRLAVVFDELPTPVLQHPVGPYLLDLAYPVVRLGIEYDGREHLTPERALRDLDRQAYLTRAGWKILRFRAHEVHRPAHVAGTVRGELIRAGRRRRLALAELLIMIDPRCTPTPS